VIIKEGDVGSDNGADSKSRRERIAADNPRHRDARGLTKTLASSGYKSQKKNRTQERKRRRREERLQ